MYQKFNYLQNIIIILIGAICIMVVFALMDFPVLICVLLVLAIVVICSILMLRIIASLRHEAMHIKNVVPASTAQAVELDHLLVIMYDQENNEVTWQNEYATDTFGNLLGADVNKICEGDLLKEVDEGEENIVYYENHYYRVVHNKDTFVLMDVSKRMNALHKYEDNKDCVINIRIDSIDDLSESLDDVTYLNLIQSLRTIINDFASEYDSLLRRLRSDSYLMIVKKKDINHVIEDAISVLEKVKENNSDVEDKITVSMGIAYDFGQLKDLQYEAGAALDMALARGGDQIVVKENGLSYQFFGGNSEASEKRNRVKVRMMASTLENLIREASNVLIMPHRNADMDAIGGAFGMAKFVRINNKKANVIGDVNTLEITTQDAFDTLELADENLLINEDEALEIIDQDTLLIIVDTSNVELLESQKVYEAVEKKVVIDHHRRGENFIEKPLLIYIESYASSTVELVSELLRFQSRNYRLGTNVATLMLAGMMVDTSYFTVRTGVRTFDAAALLRDQGANPLDAKELLQVNIDTYQKRLAIVSDAKFYNDKIAVATYTKEQVSRSLLAQSAVELLDVKDIVATFVIGYLQDGSVGISARSNGDLNVQHILEAFGGGGHFSMAAAQVKGKVEDVEVQLTKMLQEIEEGK